MSLAENKSIVRRVVEEAQSRGDMRVVDELFSPDFVDHNALPGVPPTRAGVKLVTRGPASLRNAVRASSVASGPVGEVSAAVPSR